MAHSSWGPGWPNCSSARIVRDFGVDTVQGWVTFPGGIRLEIAELVSRLVQETARRGYWFGVEGNPSYGCWGYNCRAISGTKSPSNHSWGLAVDINAPSNPMRRPLTTDMPGWMPELWNAYGFRWGGSYTTTPDAMHYEFMGSVQAASDQTMQARNNHLGEEPWPEPLPPEPDDEDDDMKAPETRDERALLINGWFKQYLHRYPGVEESAFWVEQMEISQFLASLAPPEEQWMQIPIAQIHRGIVGSDESAANEASDREAVANLRGRLDANTSWVIASIDAVRAAIEALEPSVEVDPNQLYRLVATDES